MVLPDWLRRITPQRSVTPGLLLPEEVSFPLESAPPDSLDRWGLLSWEGAGGLEKPRRALSKEIETMRQRLALPATVSLPTLIRAVQGLPPAPKALSYGSSEARSIRGRVHEAEKKIFGESLSPAPRYTSHHTFAMLLKTSSEHMEELRQQPPVEHQELKTWSTFAKFSSSYSLSILFGGCSWAAASHLMKAYSQQLEHAGSSKQAALELLQELALLYLPGRSLHHVSDEEVEFYWETSTASTGSQAIEEAIQKAIVTGAPLEFEYMSERPRAWRLKGPIDEASQSGMASHMRRINPFSFTRTEEGWPDSFTGRHARGIRTFKVNRMRAASLPSLTPASVGPEPFAKVAYRKEDQKFHFAFGFLTDDGGIGATDARAFAWHFAAQNATEG